MSESKTPITDACEVMCDCGANYVQSDFVRRIEERLAAVMGDRAELASMLKRAIDTMYDCRLRDEAQALLARSEGER